MQNFLFHMSTMRSCCDGTLDRESLMFWSRLTGTSVNLRIKMISTMPSTNCTESAIRRCFSFANVARAAYLKHDSYGHPLPHRTKGVIFLRQAKIPGHLEDHIMPKTNGSRNFSDLLEAIQVLARRPMSQTSSSYPSFNDD